MYLDSTVLESPPSLISTMRDTLVKLVPVTIGLYHCDNIRGNNGREGREERKKKKEGKYLNLQNSIMENNNNNLK